tara:strand:+ start:498 stop:1292 length:795 start_codon:yes stop_codon:yes gene_type:complete
MSIACVTTYNKKLYEKYAQTFVETYNWDFPLFVYAEEDMGKAELPIQWYKNTYTEVPGCKKFVDENKDRVPWYDKGAPSQGNIFLFDAARFCHKVYAYCDFIINHGDDYKGVICIDADSVFYKPCDEAWIDKYIHRDDCMMSYMGRGREFKENVPGSQYSECGYLYFNMMHPKTKDYAKAVLDVYNSGKIFDLKEWHDSYVWDWVRLKFQNKYQIKNNNIGDNKPGHVQPRICLGEIYDHCKGKKRKENKGSPESRLFWKKNRL